MIWQKEDTENYKCEAIQCIHHNQNKEDGCDHDYIIPKPGLFCMKLANGYVNYFEMRDK